MEKQEKQPPTDSGPRPARKAGSRGRMSRRLVITSSAAILAVYAVGFVHTQASADRVSNAASQFKSGQTAATTPTAEPTVAPAVSAPAPTDSTSPAQVGDDNEKTTTPAASDDSGVNSTDGSTASATATVAPSPTQPPPATATTAPAAATRYRDGTYAGTGMSRHGDIAAKVTVKSGKIVSAQITGCYTRYPCSEIASLPGEVINQQSTNVDMVSGATDSSGAFLQAVDNALQKALG